jgi:cation diffusion facilitator family transporter
VYHEMEMRELGLMRSGISKKTTPKKSLDRRGAYTQAVRKVTLLGMAVNIALAAIKFFFGIIAGSQALVADAVHSLSDLVTDAAVLVGVRYWSAPPDADHPHGHGRIEMLVSFGIGLGLAAVGAGLAYRALSTLHQHHGIIPGWSALAAAMVSIIAKELLYRWTATVGKRIKSTAVIANAWHHRSDALSSIPVVVAVAGTQLYPSWSFLDHIATVLVAVLIAYAAWSISWPALRQLLDTGIDRKGYDQLKSLALETPGVRAVHALRTRYIGPGIQVDVHVQVDPELTVRDGHNICGAVKQRLIEFGPEVVDVLIHLEPDESLR